MTIVFLLMIMAIFIISVVGTSLTPINFFIEKLANIELYCRSHNSKEQVLITKSIDAVFLSTNYENHE